MDINDRLYVEIVPIEGPSAPQPHPVTQGGFDVEKIYRVLGMYNPSETSECYLVLANPRRQIWFISNRHTRAWGVCQADALFADKADLPQAWHEPAGDDGRDGVAGRRAAALAER